MEAYQALASLLFEAFQTSFKLFIELLYALLHTFCCRPAVSACVTARGVINLNCSYVVVGVHT